jgi:hypothetical protein
MIARLARSIGASVVACLAGTALLLLALQALSGEWSLHTTLDLGGTLFALATAVSVVTCCPIFVLLRGSEVVSERGRAALAGASSAALTGVVVVAWFFADGIYPRDFGDWLHVLASVFFVPFPIAGAAFGYVWPSHDGRAHVHARGV